MNRPPRDPKMRPAQGDVLLKKGIRREVLEVHSVRGNPFQQDWIHVRDGGHIKPPRERRPALSQFRRWAKNATVEHQGDAR